MTIRVVPLRADTLAARLQDLGILTPQQLEAARQELSSTQERFSAILARQGLLRDPDAGKRLAPQLGSLPQRLDSPPKQVPTTTQVSAVVWQRHRLMPLQEAEGKLLLATDDPLSVFALDYFGQQCGRTLEAVLIREQDFTALLQAPASPPPVSASPKAEPPRGSGTLGPPAAGQTGGGTHEPTHAMPPPPRTDAASQARPAAAAAGDTGDEPIILLIDSVLAEAVRRRASDIHIEPETDALRVRYRIDGVLHDVNSPPKALQGPIVSRIKIMAGLNIAEKRLPQDGRLQLAVESRAMDVRVSVLPAMHGESIVMRLLDRGQPIRGLPELGMLPENQQAWDGLIHRPHGMLLVTGPTGSGKTTTLYGALGTLNQPDRKLITVEDPVEYQLAGVNQVQVRSSVGMTFAAGLRAMLRQAPDVIMVGEIRDQETAQIAIQAALTGHLVLSTLHTNDAPSAVTRLIDMGIAPFLVASTVQGVLAQRLVRRICPSCRITDNATEEERAFLGPPDLPQVIRSNGCDKCQGTGFRGRVGLFELLGMSDPIRQLIAAKTSASAIRQAALKAGMRGLRDDGRMKIREGLTTMVEVLRVATEEA